MQQYFSPKVLFKLSTVFLLMLTLFVLHSCKKATYQDIADGITDPEVLQAKDWYQNTYPQSIGNTFGNPGSNTISSNTGAGNRQAWAGNFSPDWQRGLSYSRKNATAIELPMAAGTKLDLRAPGDKLSRSGFLILKQNGVYKAYVMVMMADPDYAARTDSAKLAKNTYRHREADFSGKLLYLTPEGKFVSGWIYKNGKVLAKLTNSTLSTQAGNGKLHTTADAIQVCISTVRHFYENNVEVGQIVLYTVCYTYSSDDPDYSGDGSGGLGSAAPCPPDTVTAYHPAGKLAVNVIGDPTGGIPPDDGGFPPPVITTVDSPCTVPDIIDSVKNPCLKMMVDSIMSKNIKGKIDSMIQSVFGGNSKLNLTFTDQIPMSSSTRAAEETPVYDQNNPTILIGASIRLNVDTLSVSSKEYIAATIMHEALHAYMDSKGIAFDSQHAEMAAKYLNAMAADLKAMFRGMNDTIAYSLAWGGLEGTPLYANPGSVNCPGYQTEIDLLYRKKATDPVTHVTFGHGC